MTVNREIKSRFASRKRAVEAASRGMQSDFTLGHDLPNAVVSVRGQFNTDKERLPCVIFRPWPVPDGEGGFLPGRIGYGPFDITDWSSPATHVLCGPPKGERISFHTSLGDSAGLADAPDPYALLSSRIFRWHRNGGPDWLASFFPEKVKGASYVPPCLPLPAPVYYFQGSVVMTGMKDELYDGTRRPPLGHLPDDPTPVIRLTGDAGNNLFNQLAEKKPANQIKPGTDQWDFESRLLFGDPVHPDHGRFIHVWNAAKYQLPASEQMRESLTYRSRLSGDSNKFSKYNVLSYRAALVPGRAGPAPIKPQFDQAICEQVRRKFIPWDTLLRVPDPEEMCVLLARVFHEFGVLFEYAWGDQSDFLAHARPYLRDRTTSLPSGGHNGGDSNASEDLNRQSREWAGAALTGGAGSGGDSESEWLQDDGDPDVDGGQAVDTDGEAYGEDYAEAEGSDDPASDDSTPDEGVEDFSEPPDVEENFDEQTTSAVEDDAGDAPFDDVEGDQEFATGVPVTKTPPASGRPMPTAGVRSTATAAAPKGAAQPAVRPGASPAAAKTGEVANLEKNEMAKKSAAKTAAAKPAAKPAAAGGKQSPKTSVGKKSGK